MTEFALAIALSYAALLFLIAFLSDRERARHWLASPFVYTLSISVYCTSWTFYGAVGSATRSGLEYLTIYLGPTLVFLGFWTVLRKLLHITRRDNLTTVADFISARYGKSDGVAALVTIICVAATAPYIALQIRAMATSFAVISADVSNIAYAVEEIDILAAFWIAAGLAIFTILFGTRSVDVNERHFGVVAAIAVEGVVKLIALISVGLLAVFSLQGGAEGMTVSISDSLALNEEMAGARWIGLTLLAGMAIITLPRQFQVTFVENQRASDLYTASWLFPLYLLLMSVFILPIAAVGQTLLPSGADPDMYVLTLPMTLGYDTIAVMAFIGGLSSGTAMVIVSCIALSTMISNHLVLPLVLRTSMDRFGRGGDFERLLLTVRRLAIAFILAVGFVYLWAGASTRALASIGLIAFAGVAQLVPALIVGLYWEGATKRGAILGLVLGFLTWLFCLLLPEFLGGLGWWQRVEAQGLLGFGVLRPHALFGIESSDPLLHALAWSMIFNTVGLVVGSLSARAQPYEERQATLFVNAMHGVERTQPSAPRTVSVDRLFDLAQRVMGADRAYRTFRSYAAQTGSRSDFPTVNDAFIGHLERRFAASVGAASARAMMLEATGGERVTLDELVEIADETARLMRHSTEVERKSVEIEEVARRLRAANDQLRVMDREKDEFLSQVSHELRTPMTSIKSFSDILINTGDLTSEERARFTGIIHSESIRLTELLDEIVDLSALARPDSDLALEPIDPEAAIDLAIDSSLGLMRVAGVRLLQDRARGGVLVEAHVGRLSQVIINILSNALKYGRAAEPQIHVATRLSAGIFTVIISDNGPGIPAEERERIFGKFVRGVDAGGETGAGLGLAISQRIVERFGGTLSVLGSNGPGAKFEVTLPIMQNS